MFDNMLDMLNMMYRLGSVMYRLDNMLDMLNMLDNMLGNMLNMMYRLGSMTTGSGGMFDRMFNTWLVVSATTGVLILLLWF